MRCFFWVSHDDVRMVVAKGNGLCTDRGETDASTDHVIRWCTRIQSSPVKAKFRGGVIVYA